MPSLYSLDEIPALGSISTIDALKLQGFLEDKGDFGGIFSEKVVLDIGSGLSDFLEYIGAHSKPKRLIAVDPIYVGETEYKKAIERTRKLIEDLRIGFLEGGSISENADLQRIISSLDERDHILDTAPSRRLKTSIEHSPSLKKGDLVEADFIFITFLLEHIEDWRLFLEDLEKYLKIGGKVIITDFLARPQIRVLLERINLGESNIRILGKDKRNRISIEITR